MVERSLPINDDWVAVDAYIAATLLGDDPALRAALAANAAARLPDIDVSPPQGRMLNLLVRMMRARRVLEIGTLGGYSTIELARGVGDDGRVVTLEIDPHFAAVARANIDAAGVGDRVDIRVGAAVDTLAAMIAAGEGGFDLVFIDADKPSNVAYLAAALALARPGGAIIVDNVVREGGVLDAASDDPRIIGTRALFAAVAAEPRLTATAIPDRRRQEMGWLFVGARQRLTRCPGRKAGRSSFQLRIPAKAGFGAGRRPRLSPGHCLASTAYPGESRDLTRAGGPDLRRGTALCRTGLLGRDWRLRGGDDD